MWFLKGIEHFISEMAQLLVDICSYAGARRRRDAGVSQLDGAAASRARIGLAREVLSVEEEQ
jgi:hypothetical protein